MKPFRGTPDVYIWKRKPRDDTSARLKIARCLGAAVNGFRDIVTPNGSSFRVTVGEVYRHFWKTPHYYHRVEEERWRYVPAIIPAVKSAYRFGGTVKTGRKGLYGAVLYLGRRGEKLEPTLVGTIVTDRGANRDGSRKLTWDTTYLPESVAALNETEKELGYHLWNSQPPAKTRNPIPVWPHHGASPSGSAPVDRSLIDNYTTRRQDSGRLGLILVVTIVGLSWMSLLSNNRKQEVFS